MPTITLRHDPESLNDKVISFKIRATQDNLDGVAEGTGTFSVAPSEEPDRWYASIVVDEWPVGGVGIANFTNLDIGQKDYDRLRILSQKEGDVELECVDDSIPFF